MASINSINNTVADNNLSVTNTVAGATASNIYIQKSRTGGIITTGDALGAFIFTGNDGASDLVTSQITCTSSGTIAATRIGSDLKFYTHPDSIVASTLRMTIASTGEVTIAAPDSGTGLTVAAGGLTVTAGGIGVTAGGLTVTAGGLTVTAGGLTVTAGNTTLTPLGTAGHVVNSAAGLLSTAATTQYCVQVGGATGAFTSLAVGTSGQLLQSAGAGANPAWTTTTYPATSTKGDLVYASANNVLSVLAKDATATRYLANTGVDNVPKWDQVDLTNGVTGVLPIANGGTNASSMTNTYGVNYFDGTRVVTTTVGTAAQVLTSNGAGVAPTFQDAAGGLLPWTEKTLDYNAAVNNGYIHTAINVDGTLPATAAVGDIFRFAGGVYPGSSTQYYFSVLTGAGQTIYLNASTKTTTGVGGKVSGDGAIEIICVIADTKFKVLSYTSSLTWV